MWFTPFFVQKNPIEIKKKYGIPDKLEWSIELTSDGWFVVECKEIRVFLRKPNQKRNF